MSSCSASCGGGIVRQAREVLAEPSEGGMMQGAQGIDGHMGLMGFSMVFYGRSCTCASERTRAQRCLRHRDSAVQICSNSNYIELVQVQKTDEQ